jgi:hypothetical protein
MMHCARQIPGVVIERRLQVAPLVAARQMLASRPGWCAIFTKAYAVVARDLPALRAAYMSFPWPHLYEHPLNFASIIVERDFGGEMGVLMAHIRGPENHSLPALDTHIRWFKEQPLQESAYFRRVWRLCQWPWFIRRLVWNWGYHSSGARRARHMGTFGVTSVAGFGAHLASVQSPLATTLSYGPIDEQGQVTVNILFDHRVADGATMARALEEMQQVLLGNILRELQQLAAAESWTGEKGDIALEPRQAGERLAPGHGPGFVSGNSTRVTSSR